MLWSLSYNTIFHRCFQTQLNLYSPRLELKLIKQLNVFGCFLFFIMTTATETFGLMLYDHLPDTWEELGQAFPDTAGQWEDLSTFAEQQADDPSYTPRDVAMRLSESWKTTKVCGACQESLRPLNYLCQGPQSKSKYNMDLLVRLMIRALVQLEDHYSVGCLHKIKRHIVV